ncbi:hypothetical protein E4U42_007585 [Claviceps africana]|uniref:Uncharacterized protein n=1 Tax=Claviceps africana TaxID=83212 RepID=A0A8K0JBD3_9HYPO|nr:hypothetical protein E4U42_007585 [Claviceps africana]
MSRITAPIAKLARALSSGSPHAASVGPRSASGILDSSAHCAGASLMPKYAELLHNRRGHEHSDSPRGLTTTHRPTPQPSLTNRPRPLMQTFHSASASAAPVLHTTSHIDAAVLPPAALLYTSPSSSGDEPRVPLLPDNYAAAHGPITAKEADPLPKVTIVAANPDNVVPGPPNAGIEGIGLDGIELKFLYDESSLPREEPARGGMIRDIWKGMVGDAFGKTAKKAV